jgi:hypothetical protein
LWDETNGRLLNVIQNDRHLCHLEFEFLSEMKYFHIESEPVNFGSAKYLFCCFRGESFQTALCVEVGAPNNEPGELIKDPTTLFAKGWSGCDLTTGWVAATA